MMTMSKVKGFTFYKSYFDCVKELSEEDRQEVLIAMIEFVFSDKIPKFNGIKKTIWFLIEPNLNTSKNRSKVSKGAPEGNHNALKNKEEIDDLENKQKTNKKQTKIKQKTNNDLKNISLSLSLSNSLSYSNSNIQSNNILNNLFIEYIKLREDNKYNTSETVISRLLNKLETYGQNDEDKKEIIENAIMGKWKDFYEIDNKKKKEVVKYETVR